MIVRKEAEEYIKMFIALNKNIGVPQHLKDAVHNHINLLYSLQTLPVEIFEEIIKKL